MDILVSLTPELEQLVSDKVKIGQFPPASDVIGEGLRLLQERDEQAGTLRREVRAGFEAAERGEFSEYGISDLFELAERVKARGRERLREQERQRSIR